MTHADLRAKAADLFAPVLQCTPPKLLGSTGPDPAVGLDKARKVFCEFKEQSLLYDACGCSQQPSMAAERRK